MSAPSLAKPRFLTRADLAGYSEDLLTPQAEAKWLRRRFASIWAFAGALVLVGLVLAFGLGWLQQPEKRILLIFGSLIGLACVWAAFLFVGSRRRSTRPMSVVSGRKMECCINREPEQKGTTEYFYVCDHSRTYYREVFYD